MMTANQPTIEFLEQDPTTAYRIHLLITKEDEGGFSAYALNLPGAGSSGESVDEAVSNAKEAIRGVIASYEGEEIPWVDSSKEDVPFGEQKWIIVHV